MQERARDAIGKLESVLNSTGVIFNRLKAKQPLDIAFEPLEIPLGEAVRSIGFYLEGDVKIDGGYEQLDRAKEQLQHGTLFVVSPFHSSVYDAIPIIKIIENLFAGSFDKQIWPWSYKFDRRVQPPGIEKRVPLVMRLGARGLAEASKIEPIFLIQPKYRNLTPENESLLNQWVVVANMALTQDLGRPRTLYHIFPTGTRQHTFQLERPQRTALAFFLRNKNVALLPVTHSRKTNGLDRELHVNLGSVLTGQDIRTFQQTHRWKQINDKFSYDDALMALIAQTTRLPVQKNGVDPKGIYHPDNIMEIS